MKGSSNIVSAVHKMRMVVEHFESFQREHPGSKGARLFANYVLRINWIANDLFTNPFLPNVVREGIKKEWESDVFGTDAIAEKVALLSPEKREAVETLIDSILDGKEVKISTHEKA